MKRKGFKSAIAHLAVARVLIEVSSAVLPAYDTPPFVLKPLKILPTMGFPVNLDFFWVYDVTPDGLKRTGELSHNTSSHIKGRRLNRVIMGFLSIAVIILAYNQFGRSASKEMKEVIPVTLSDTLAKTIAVMPFNDNSKLRTGSQGLKN